MILVWCELAAGHEILLAVSAGLEISVAERYNY
jgi:hypothetical protein